jgi:hypothetical protein
MKRILFILLMLGQLPALASQIVVGLRSDNLLSWGVWEREGTRLKHYLLLYNKGSQPLTVTIREQRFRPAGSNFADVGTHKLLHRTQLKAQQLVRLRYPASRGKLDFMEYFENGASIGLLPINARRPDAVALGGVAYRFYTSEGANSDGMSYWLAFNSLYSPPTHLQLTAEPTEPRAAGLRRGEEEYGLVKLYAPNAATPTRPGTLDSLFTTGVDPTIARLDNAQRSATLTVRSETIPAQLTMLVLHTENVSKFFRYNEQRQLVEDKAVGGAQYFFPLFPRKPN